MHSPPGNTFKLICEQSATQGGAFIVLIDPDKTPFQTLPSFVEKCEVAGVDALFLGGSLMHAPELDRFAAEIKSVSDLPLIGFPGALNQLSANLDALLYLSVISSRNPELLIGQHVKAAPIIKRLQLETIATGYMLVESGSLTTAQYMTHSMPLPRRKPDVAAATALAAQYMGMQTLFADGGSGAEKEVPLEMIEAISETCSIPLITGGGISSPESVAERIDAGASFVVIGNAIEKNPDLHYIAELAAAAHSRVARAIPASQ